MKKNIYLFYGDEDFLIDEKIIRLRDLHIEPSLRDYNYSVMDFDDVDEDMLIQSILTPPMWGGNKFIVIKNPDGPMEKVIDALDNISPDTVVVFAAGGPVDKREKFYKRIEKLAQIAEFKTYAHWQEDKLISFINDLTKKTGKKINLDAAQFLLETVGNNLRMLATEVEKLAAYSGESDVIEKKDVEQIAASGSIDSFSLLNSLRDRNLAKSLESLDRLIKDREDPVRLLQLIATQYRTMLKVKDIGPYDLKRIGAAPYFVKKCDEAANHFTVAQLKNAIHLMSNADIKLKNSSQAPRSVLELLLAEIC